MRVLPAVDIRAGHCVNLVQGDFAQETIFSQDPVAQAILWHDGGAPLVHVVDLDGAREGRVCVGALLQAMAAAGVPFEVGGGIRDMSALHEVFEAGAERAIIGTAAFKDPAFLREAARAYPGRIVAGIDAKEGRVALSGWREVTQADAVGFARQVEEAGAARIVYTDILSDGMMQGPNFAATRAVATAVGIPVTASGGISSLNDVRALRALEGEGVDEVIIGRALYLGAFTLEEALATARDVP